MRVNRSERVVEEDILKRNIPVFSVSSCLIAQQPAAYLGPRVDSTGKGNPGLLATGKANSFASNLFEGARVQSAHIQLATLDC